MEMLATVTTTSVAGDLPVVQDMSWWEKLLETSPILAMVVLWMIFIFCVFRTSKNDMKDMYDDAKKRCDVAITNARSDCEFWVEQAKKLFQETDESRQINYDNLQKSYDELKKENSELREEKKDLINENSELKKENNELRKNELQKRK